MKRVYSNELSKEPERYYTYAEVDTKLRERPKLNLENDSYEQKETWY